MLPQVNRLRQRQEFQRIYREGKCCRGCCLTLRARRGDDRSPPRIGIVVSQKVSKKAVVRNQIKRRIRAALRQLLPQLPPGWQIVVSAKNRATQCEYEDFLRELEELFIQTEVLDGH